MATLTLRLPPVDAEIGHSKPSRGFLRRWYDAMIESRMRQAEREVARYRHLVPTDPVKDAGYRVGLRDVGALPFVR